MRHKRSLKEIDQKYPVKELEETHEDSGRGDECDEKLPSVAETPEILDKEEVDDLEEPSQRRLVQAEVSC
jgi:hypothetical protein